MPRIDDETSYILSRITRLRTKQGVKAGKYLSEKQLSRDIGKSDSYLSTLNSNKTLPSMKTIIRLCEYFDISLFDFFLEEEDDPVFARTLYRELRQCSEDDRELITKLIHSLAGKGANKESES